MRIRSFAIIFVSVLRKFCDYKNTEFFSVQIWIWKSDSVENCERQKSGN